MKIGNIECYGIIYKVTNTINNKVYIGQSSKGYKNRYKAKGNGIQRLYYHNISQKKNNRYYNEHLLRSVEKYGFDAFEVIEIYDVAFSKKELDIKEKHYIQLFDCISNGYNHTEGGGGVRLFGELNPFYGRKHTQETKDKISKNHADVNGENNPMWNKKHKQETIDKISKSKKDKHKGKNNPNAKAVICITTGKIFDTAKEASIYYNIKSSGDISSCCNGKLKSAGKLSDGTRLVWKFLKDFNLH